MANALIIKNKEPRFFLHRTFTYLKKYKYLYLLLLPGIIYFIIFHYIPMYGIVIAFKDFNFSKGIIGSPWNDFKHFKTLFGSPDFYKILFNSVYLSVLRIAITFPVPIILALLLNEIDSRVFKRISQTVMYLPHFISWVVIGGITINFLSTDGGLVNEVVKMLELEPIPFLGSTSGFRPVVLATNIWKEAGWGTIIYLAALSGISPEYFEAATVDGANRIQKIVHITLPCISSTIIILLVLAIGKIMNNGFEQIFLLQNDLNLKVSEVFETYTYRLGLLNGEFSFASAVGLFQSVVGAILVFSSNKISRMLGQEALY